MAAAANRRKIPGAPGPAVGDVQQVFASLIPRRITDEKAYLSIVPIKARPIRKPLAENETSELKLIQVFVEFAAQSIPKGRNCKQDFDSIRK